jgi:3-dehydroquinate synthase
MEDLRVSDSLSIQSYQGKYTVEFNHGSIQFSDESCTDSHFIIDKKIAELYKIPLKEILKSDSVLLIEADEANKSLDRFPGYVEHLVAKKLRRNQRLIAIGGGIIQDITCFLAATMLRGVDWHFYPTTLLAQADSCIGSKSSINCGSIKNILGTFTPPKKIVIYREFLKTLDLVDVRSGVGEMLKVHAIDGEDAFSDIARDYEKLFSDEKTMLHYIKQSLIIKKGIIEQDEFDRNIRNVMNYGHTFGHAIESATNYQIPHGVAVTIGMDMANFVSYQFEHSKQSYFADMHPVLKRNYTAYIEHNIPLESFLSAISKDKKNRGNNEIGAILPNQDAKPNRVYLQNDEKFKSICAEYLTEGRLL